MNKCQARSLQDVKQKFLDRQRHGGILYFVNTKWSKNNTMGHRGNRVKQAGIQLSLHTVEYSNDYVMQSHSYSLPELI